MTRAGLNSKYFKWMYELVCEKDDSGRSSYWDLLQHLHAINFTWTIHMDNNRSSDGIDLRYRFGREEGYQQAVVATYLDDCADCSVLEMMVALVVRCEEHIMGNSELGDRTKKWFWDMLTSLKLTSMTDANFDKNYVEDVIGKFLTREYRRNGVGGLFTVKKPQEDMRSVEIWYQMCWYLNEL